MGEEPASTRTAVLWRTMSYEKSYSIEKARSGRSTCKKCKSKIEKDILRIGITTDHPEFGETTKWEHVECHKFMLASPEELSGWEELGDDEQEACTTILNQKGNKRPPPKQEVKPFDSCKKLKMGDLKSQLEERGLETDGKKAVLIERLAAAMATDAPSADQIEFLKVEAEFSSMTNTVLKELLGRNDQKKSGNKPDLVARCTDCKMYGCLPKCPECGGGRMDVSYPTRWNHGGQGKFRCKGHYDDDEFIRCGHTEDQMERAKWVALEE